MASEGLMKRMQTGRSSQGIEGYEGGPLWRQRPTLGFSANEEEEDSFIQNAKQISREYNVKKKRVMWWKFCCWLESPT